MVCLLGVKYYSERKLNGYGFTLVCSRIERHILEIAREPVLSAYN